MNKPGRPAIDDMEVMKAAVCWRIGEPNLPKTEALRRAIAHCGGINSDENKIGTHVERIRKKLSKRLEQKLIADISNPSQPYVLGELSTMKLSSDLTEQERDFEEFMACVARLTRIYFVRTLEEKTKALEADFKLLRTVEEDQQIKRNNDFLLEKVKGNREFTKAIKKATRLIARVFPN